MIRIIKTDGTTYWTDKIFENAFKYVFYTVSKEGKKCRHTLDKQATAEIMEYEGQSEEEEQKDE